MTSTPPQSNIWKIRAVKAYPEAHSHLLIGRIVENTSTCVRVFGRSIHHGRVVNNTDDVRIGAVEMRLIPWNRIEIINELPRSFDFQAARLKKDADGNIFLSDGTFDCTIQKRTDLRY